MDPGDKRLAAAVVMDDEGRVLLVRRSGTERYLPRVWGVPCGKPEPDERPEDGALRELPDPSPPVMVTSSKPGNSFPGR